MTDKEHIEKRYCDIKHDTLDDDIKDIKDTVREHTKQISKLEKNAEANGVQVKNLVKSIESLVSWIKWGLAFFITSFITFSIWMLQQQLIR